MKLLQQYAELAQNGNDEAAQFIYQILSIN